MSGKPFVAHTLTVTRCRNPECPLAHVLMRDVHGDIQATAALSFEDLRELLDEAEGLHKKELH